MHTPKRTMNWKLLDIATPVMPQSQYSTRNGASTKCIQLAVMFAYIPITVMRWHIRNFR